MCGYNAKISWIKQVSVPLRGFSERKVAKGIVVQSLVQVSVPLRGFSERKAKMVKLQATLKQPGFSPLTGI